MYSLAPSLYITTREALPTTRSWMTVHSVATTAITHPITRTRRSRPRRVVCTASWLAIESTYTLWALSTSCNSTIVASKLVRLPLSLSLSLSRCGNPLWSNSLMGIVERFCKVWFQGKDQHGISVASPKNYSRRFISRVADILE